LKLYIILVFQKVAAFIFVKRIKHFSFSYYIP